MISVTEFNEALAASLTPITLISGVGLLMICMTNRYNHATNRIRLLMAKRDTSPQRLVPVIDEEIEIIFNRVATLRRGLLCVSISALLSALLVSVSVAGRFLGVDLSAIEGIMLVTAIALIVVSALLFSAENTQALHALKIAIAATIPPDESEDERSRSCDHSASPHWNYTPLPSSIVRPKLKKIGPTRLSIPSCRNTL